MDRARLTITDVVYVLMAVAGLAALYPVYSSLLNGTASRMDPGTAVVFQSMLAVMLVVLLSVIYVEARSGRAR
jgi:hypothetical protein